MKAAASQLSITPKRPWVGAPQGAGQIQAQGGRGGGFQEDGSAGCGIHRHPILSYHAVKSWVCLPGLWEGTCSDQLGRVTCEVWCQEGAGSASATIIIPVCKTRATPAHLFPLIRCLLSLGKLRL